MDYIDLHVHSHYSDGTFSPAQLVERGLTNHLTAFALTDHDSIQGIEEAMAAAENTGISVIPGIELSAEYQEKEVHILGYQFDYHNAHLTKRLHEIVTERDQRNVKMAKALADAGFPISYEELIQEYGNAVITRAHFAKLLLKKGAIPTFDSAFKGCLANNSPYYIHRQYPTAEEAIQLIVSSGGIPVLAHPLLYKYSVSQLRSLLTDLKTMGLVGIEALYSCNRGNDEAFVKKLAVEHDLLITGGSDFHGANKPHIDMGTGMGNLYVHSGILDSLLAR